MVSKTPEPDQGDHLSFLTVENHFFFFFGKTLHIMMFRFYKGAVMF